MLDFPIAILVYQRVVDKFMKQLSLQLSLWQEFEFKLVCELQILVPVM